MEFVVQKFSTGYGPSNVPRNVPINVVAVIVLLYADVMASIGDKWIDKLDGTNWTTWKFQMQHLLMAKEVWEQVTGTVPDPGEDAAARTRYDKAKQKAMATLVVGIHAKLIYLVTSCVTPKEVWDTLKGQFERNTFANKMFLKRQYFTTKMSEGQLVQDHLKSMKEITDKLAALGSAVAEEEQVVALLISLPPSYQTLVTALEAKGEDLSLEFVQQALVSEEQKRQVSISEAVTESDQNAALQVNRGTVKPFKGRCYKCNKEGHKSYECHEKLDKSNRLPVRRNFQKLHRAKTVSEDNNQTDSESELFFSATGQPEGKKHQYWIVDSGASRHMTSNKKLLTDYCEFAVPETVKLGDGRSVEALGTGRVRITVETSEGKKTTMMGGVLYVPKLACNLFSVRAVTQKGQIVQFGQNVCWIKCRGKVLAKGRLVNRMYQLNCETLSTEDSMSVADAYVNNNKHGQLNLWHQRLGHLNVQQLKQAVKRCQVKGIDLQDNDRLDFCEGCVEGKMSRYPFKPVGEIKSTRKLKLVHSDVCGPMPTESFNGKRYFVTFTDDYTRCVKVYFIRHKSEVLQKFKEFEAAATNEAGCKIGILRTDNGGEYVSSEFEEFLKSKGIKHETTVVHSPQQNGVSERMNRTLLESAKAMIFHAGLSKSFWAEAVNTAAYIRNRVTTTSTGQTPYERWYRRIPDVSHMRVLGCTAYAHCPEADRRKLDKKSRKLRFLGYAEGQKAYRLLDMKKKKLVISRDVIFNEFDYGQQKEPVEIKSDAEEEPEQSSETTEHAVAEQSQQSDPRRSERTTKGQKPTFYGFDEYADVTEKTHIAFRATIEEPETIQEALNSEYSVQWKAAADSEYQSLMENKTWELVKLPDNRTVIGCKWIFKVKYGDQGQVNRFKGRLVAKGYSQKYGKDFDETFSPVVRFDSIRTLLAFAVEKQMLIHQMDVVAAFLHGDLEEDIYMEQPEGYVIPGKEDMVCKLKKSLYGLKQSPRCWNRAFTDSMKSLNFTQSQAEPCMFIRRSADGTELSIIALYVDDLITVTTNEAEMNEIKASLRQNFKMKDMGSLHFCLGVNIKQCTDMIKLSQKQYIQKLLKRYELTDANPVSTPMDLNVRLVAADGHSKPTDKVRYQSMVGSLLYVAIATRPDISQAVGAVSQFNSAPTEAHLTAVKRILRYLKGTIDLSLQYKCTKNIEVTGYSDADWASDMDSRRSTTGNVFKMAAGAVTWLSQKQSTVALSTAEAEYIALSSATQEVIWLRQLLTDIGENCTKPVTVWEDNQAAIGLTRNPIGHKRTKHIDIKYHFVREHVLNGNVLVKYCNTKDMVADIFTKSLPRKQFEYLRSELGIN